MMVVLPLIKNPPVVANLVTKKLSRINVLMTLLASSLDTIAITSFMTEHRLFVYFIIPADKKKDVPQKKA